MKRFDSGMWMLFGTLAVAMLTCLFYMTLLQAGTLYVYGRGNPEWVDFGFSLVSLVAFILMMTGLVLMYGFDTEPSNTPRA